MPHNLLAAYPKADQRFDELLQAPLLPRPHWAPLVHELLGADARHMRDRVHAVDRQIRENGVTYNVYADAKGQDRPWDLDVLPMLIPPDEWHEIEDGIAQRADVLNRILADIYGNQYLLREGLIPPQLIFGHRGFLRPAHGMQVPGGVYLHVYAADLARSPNGKWWVMADRTQSPSGAGYALENRLIVSRIFPELFRDLSVERLASFFAALRDALVQFAPSGDGHKLTVLLTPGPYNETYFEHTYLARYLGFPLVEGGDLTVRDGKVWLKTIDGLKRVHAILRRQDDDFCDPLELRSDSALGIAGLTDCARRGTVLIANALGSGVLESGSLLGFLPRLSEHLTGEKLKLPSIATWWCGEPAALEDALEKLETLVFKPANPAYSFEPVFGQDLDAAGIEALHKKISTHPERYVAQELVRVSQAPVLDREHARRLSARAVGLRVYAVATPNGYVVMPGGLTRIAASHDARVVSMQRGGGSKDTWVISPGPVNTAFSLLRSTVGVDQLKRAGAGLSSRMAENLFWFGRYAERCDNTARLLRVALGRTVLDSDDDDDASRPILALAQRCGLLDEEDLIDPYACEAKLLAAANGDDHPFGLPENLKQLSRVAFNLRERMSQDNWRAINRLLQDQMFGREASISDTLNGVDRIITGLMTLSGFALDGMTRDTGWRFLSIGRRLERMTFSTLSLQVALTEGRASGLSWLLRLSDSIITYRSRYMARPEWLPVLDLLARDDANPRSVMFTATGVLGFVRKLESRFGPCGGDLLAPHLTTLAALDADTGLRPDSAALLGTLNELRSAGFDLAELLATRFFNLADSGNRAVQAP